MNRSTRLISYFIVTLMILGSLQVSTSNSARTPEPVESSDLSSVNIIAMLPDPDFNQHPEAVIIGSSGEFSAVYPEVVGNADRYAELRWIHTANTALDHVGPDPDNIMPDYNDFVYVYQEFDWSLNQRPIDAEVYINYSTYLTGNFANEFQAGNLMFRVFVWTIDSSNNWVKLYESRDAVYTETYQMKRLNLNFLNLADIFDGMVEQNGIQEDPEDKVKLAIGLAPTYRFESYAGTEPWTYFDGSVSVRVTSCEFYAFVETEDDPNSIWQPEYNVTYGTTLRQAFPNHPNASDEVENMCYGMVTGDDGSVYVTGNTRSSYELWIQDGLRFQSQFLLKYDSTLNRIWAVNNENMTQVRSMTYHDGFVYTTGFKFTDEDMQNLILTKWSTTGTKVWEREWGEQYSQVGVGVAVHEDGSVYVIASDYDFIGFPGYQNTSILKYNNEGDLLWEKQSLRRWTTMDFRGDLYIDEDHLYYLRSYTLAILDLEGEYITDRSTRAAIPDGNGGFFSAIHEVIQGVEESSQIILSHSNTNGYQNWNTTFIRQWSNGKYYTYRPVNMALTPDDTLLLLVHSYYLNSEFRVLTYDFQGNLLNNRTITNDSWPWMSGGPIYMDVGSSGLGYFAFDIYDGDDFDINVLSYLVYEMPGITTTIAAVIIVASTVVIIGAVVGIIRWKRMQYLITSQAGKPK
ncbi:MAG: hypothetical protein ACTSV2_05975 [Candidatus Thorarchaeota archaeon]